MTIRKTLQEMESWCEVIEPFAQRNIRGGTGIPLSNTDLNLIFNFAPIGGLASPLGTAMAQEVRELAQTDMGSDILQALLNNAKATGNRIALSTGKPINGFTAYYSGITNSIDLTNISTYNVQNPVFNAKVFDVLSHELFHAYQKNVLHESNGTTSVEVDAYLFEALTEKQLDAIDGPNSIFYATGMQAELANNSTSAAYVTAFKDIVDNGKFTLANYNALIVNFKKEWPIAGYSTLRPDPIKNLDTSNLYILYTLDYLHQPLTAGSTTNIPPANWAPVVLPTVPVAGSSGLTSDQINNYIQGVLQYFFENSSGSVSTGTGAFSYDPDTQSFQDTMGNSLGIGELPPAISGMVIDSGGSLVSTLTQADIDAMSAAITAYNTPYVIVPGPLIPGPIGGSSSGDEGSGPSAGDNGGGLSSSSTDPSVVSSTSSYPYGGASNGGSYDESYSASYSGSYDGGGSYGSSYGSSYDNYC